MTLDNLKYIAIQLVRGGGLNTDEEKNIFNYCSNVHQELAFATLNIDIGISRAQYHNAQPNSQFQENKHTQTHKERAA